VDVEESSKSWRFVEQLVFLQPNTASFIPHRLHCLEVCPGIVLVLISEVGPSSPRLFSTVHFLPLRIAVRAESAGGDYQPHSPPPQSDLPLQQPRRAERLRLAGGVIQEDKQPGET
jgi:hypothetical protein